MITICYRPCIIDSFTVNNRAKLVINEQTGQGKTILCDIIMHDHFCFARIGQTVAGVVGFESDTK